MRFLILDSEEKSRVQMKYWLEEMNGSFVYVADSSEEAFSVSLEKVFDGFVVDPASVGKNDRQNDGLYFMEKIRQISEYRYVGILVMTRLEDPFFLILNTFHCCGYLPKPLNRQDSKICLRYLCDYALFRNKAFFGDRVVCVKKGRGISLVNLSSVVRIVFRNGTTEVYFSDETEQFSSRSFSRDTIVPSDPFVFCNRWEAVNMKYMESCDMKNLRLKEGLGTVEVTDSGREALLSYFRSSICYVN